MSQRLTISMPAMPSNPDLDAFAVTPPEHWDAMEYVDALPDVLRTSVEGFLYGMCFPFAVALHQITGWPMAILFDEFDGATIHAFVIAPDGEWLDAAGWRTPPDVLSCYECDDPVVVPADMDMMHRHSELLATPVAVGAAHRLIARLPHHPARALRAAQLPLAS